MKSRVGSGGPFALPLFWTADAEARLIVFLIVLLSVAHVLPAAEPLIFCGDIDYPPMVYLENGVPAGMDVDLALSLAEPLRREVRVELTDWKLAQEKVQSGKGDVLLSLSVTPEREEKLDFTQPVFVR